MRLTFLPILLALLSACTIIDDNHWEDVPTSSTVKAIIFVEPQKQEKLRGEISRDANKITVSWSGSHNPFWFKTTLTSTEYNLINNKVDRIDYKTSNGLLFSEKFYY